MKKRFVLIIMFLLLFSCSREQTEPNVFNISPSRITIPVDGGSAKVSINCDFNWEGKIRHGAWLKKESASESSFTVSAGPNFDFDFRRDTIVFKSGSASVSVPVVQEDLNSVISTRSVVLKSESGYSSFIITSPPSDWSLEPVLSRSAVSWFDVSPSSGKAGTSIMVKVVVKEANKDYEDRNAFIRVTMGGNSFFVTVTQKQKDAILLSEDKKEVSNKGGSFDIIAQTNAQLSATVDENGKEWLSSVSTRVLEEKVLRFKAEPNSGEQPRSAVITIKGGDAVETVTVYQDMRDILVLGRDVLEAGADGGSYSVDLRTNVEYEVSVSGDSEWIKITPPGERRTDRIYLDIAPNYDYDGRTAVITVRDRNSSLSQTLTVKQLQRNAIISGLKEKTISKSGESFTVGVSSNVDYIVDIVQTGNWLSRTTTRGLAEFRESFVAGVNDTVEDRTALIIFRSSGSVSDTLTVMQPARDKIIPSPKEIDIEFYGGRIETNIDANIEYDVIPDENSSWISQTSSSDVSSGRIAFKVEPNTGDSKRVGHVCLKSRTNDLQSVLTIYQYPRPFGTYLDQTIPGAYGLNGADWLYFMQKSQLSSMDTGNSMSFRLLFPADRKLLEIKGIPYVCEAGDVIWISRVVYDNGKFSSKSIRVSVEQIDGQTMWMDGGDDGRFIVKFNNR